MGDFVFEKNFFRGKKQRCFILGCGPSLLNYDLDKLEDEFVLGVNLIMSSGIVPDILCVGDQLMLHDNIDKIYDKEKNVKYYILRNLLTKRNLFLRDLKNVRFVEGRQNSPLIDPNLFVFNETGTTQTNNVKEDRKSLENVRSSASLHRIFLNDPDINVYPSGTLGEFSKLPLYRACTNGAACVEVVVTEPGQIDILVDLDTASGQFIYDKNTRDVLVAFQIYPEPGETPPYYRCVPWDGKDVWVIR